MPSAGQELLFTPFSENRNDDPELFLLTVKSHFKELNLSVDEIFEILPVTHEPDEVSWFFQERYRWSSFENFECDFLERFAKLRNKKFFRKL